MRGGWQNHWNGVLKLYDGDVQKAKKYLRKSNEQNKFSVISRRNGSVESHEERKRRGHFKCLRLSLVRRGEFTPLRQWSRRG